MVDLSGLDFSKVNPDGVIGFISDIPNKLMNFDYTRLWWLYLIFLVLGLGVLLFQLYNFILEHE